MALYDYIPYPDGLPGFYAGTGVGVENNLVATEALLGPPRQRASRPLHPYLISMRWRFTRSQFFQFKAWWRDTLKRGVLPFTGTFSVHGRTGEYRMQFITPPSFSSERGGDCVVSGQAWCWRAPEKTSEEAFAGIIDRAYLESVVLRFDSIMQGYYDLRV